MQSNEPNLFRILKRKPIMVEILNFLELKDISRTFSICKYWHQQSRGCIANYNSQIIISAGDFNDDFENFVKFIYWMTRRMFELNQI